MPENDLRVVSFIGAGQMGCFNALLAACHGYQVRLYDESAECLASFPERQRPIAEMAIQRQLVSREAVERGLPRIEACADLQAGVADADLVSESIPERLDAKRDIHRRLDAICPPHALLTTNASYLLASEIEDVVARGERFAALHSHYQARLFDIQGGPRTSPETIARLEQYVRSLQCVPLVHTKERRGFISNTLLGALNSTALMLVILGRATPQQVDRAWMHFRHWPYGPFGGMDQIGLDVVAGVTAAALAQKPGNVDLERIVAYLRPFLERGELGRKTGRGFYTYPDPEFARGDFLSNEPPKPALNTAIVRRLITASLLLVAGGYASAGNVDLVWTLITPSSEGPFAMLKHHWRELVADEFTLYSDEGHVEGLADKLAELLHAHL